MEASIQKTNQFFGNFLRYATAALVTATLACLIEPLISGRSGPGTSIDAAMFSRTFNVLTAIWFFWLGGCLGSFLNVVVYRLPRGQTLMGVSRCPFCKQRIAARDNIPIAGWLKLRSKCRHCYLPISVRYPMVELMVALLVMTLAITEVALGGANLSIQSPKPLAGFTHNLFDPQWPLILSLVWHLVIGLTLLGQALVVNDGGSLSKRWLLAGFLAVGAFAIVHPTTLYTLRHQPVEVTPWIAMRDAAIASLAGWAIGFLNLGEWFRCQDSTRKQYRQLPLMFALIGAAWGWPAVLFCGLLAPILELICRAFRVSISPALITTGVAFFYVISGFPLLYPCLRVMPI